MAKTFQYNKATNGFLETPTPAKSAFGVLGYQGRTDVPEEYIVTIYNKRPALYTKDEIIVIRAPMQEKISTSTESEWSPLAAASAISSIIPTQELTQIISGRSIVSRYASRRIWTGGGTLNFVLNLKFEVQDNASLEVVQPLKELQRMSLPYSGSNMANSTAGTGGPVDKIITLLKESFLYPPGPSPFGDLAAIGAGETITIKFGKFMKISPVVIKSIGIDVPLKFMKGGSPTGAIVSVTFQTYEIVTKETLDSFYDCSLPIELKGY
jgi:hypothetical protein